MESYRNQVEPNKYITVECLKKAFGAGCGNCGDVLTYNADDDGKLEANLTAQRIDNAVAHNQNNILPYCK